MLVILVLQHGQRYMLPSARSRSRFKAREASLRILKCPLNIFKRAVQPRCGLRVGASAKHTHAIICRMLKWWHPQSRLISDPGVSCAAASPTSPDLQPHILRPWPYHNTGESSCSPQTERRIQYYIHTRRIVFPSSFSATESFGEPTLHSLIGTCGLVAPFRIKRRFIARTSTPLPLIHKQ